MLISSQIVLGVFAFPQPCSLSDLGPRETHPSLGVASIPLAITLGAGNTFLDISPCLPPHLSLEVGKSLLLVFLSTVCLLAWVGCSLKAKSVTEDHPTPHPFLPLDKQKGPVLLGFALERRPNPEL